MSDSGVPAKTKFLSPAEVLYARNLLAHRKLMDRACFIGGYDGAERQRLVVLPSYLDGIEGDPADMFREYFPDDAKTVARIIKISGSGYVSLSHRDYLGSILGLGIQRDAIGDIVISDNFSAYTFADGKVADLLISDLVKVKTDKVKVSECSSDIGLSFKREFYSISDTVASARLDCVVASLANLSRDKAQMLIASGMCQMNYVEEARNDRGIDAGDVITLRGYGKFIIRELSDKTKKGRLRLIADKYV